MKRALITLAVFALATPAAAETVAIVNARLETAGPAGTIPSGTIVLKDGKIIAVGAGVAAPAGARVIDAAGGVVTPGLIAPSSSLTVTEVEQVSSTRDDRSGKLSAGFDISYGVNPTSTMIPLARQTGQTRAVATPVLSRGGDGGHKDDSGAEDFAGGGGGDDAEPMMFAGQAAIVSLAAGDLDPVVREDARAFARNRGAYDRGATREFGLSRVDLEALIPAVEGRAPLLVRVHRASDILQVLRLAREEKIKVILEGAEEAWLVAPQIAAAGVGVIIDSQADLPDSFESLGARLDNAARLQAAGVTVAIMGSRDLNNLRQARFNAGLAVANGLPRDQAMATVTANVAKMWGMTGVGSLTVGQDADVVLWNGDPLEVSSWPLAVFIGGVEQPQSSRAFELRDRYATPSAMGYPPAYQ